VFINIDPFKLILIHLINELIHFKAFNWIVIIILFNWLINFFISNSHQTLFKFQIFVFIQEVYYNFLLSSQ